MPWKYKGVIIQEGKSWSDGEYNHPSNWNIAWGEAEKKKAGLVFEEIKFETFDNRFYWSKDKPKNLIDTDAKDTDGKQIYEIDGKTKVINKGLKSQYIEKTKETANSLLANTDWYIIRASDDSSLAVPSDITAKRKAIRDACKKIEDSITKCSKLEDFIKLFDVPMKDGFPTGNPPIYDFPE